MHNIKIKVSKISNDYTILEILSSLEVLEHDHVIVSLLCCMDMFNVLCK